MPVNLSNLREDTRTIEVAIGAETLHVRYRPSGLTPETEDELRELIQDQRGGASLVAALVRTVQGWDLMDENGHEVGVDEETLRTLPMLFLNTVAEAVANDIYPNRTSGETSAAGSRRKAR